MKYDLTDEEVDRMVQGNKKLHIELAAMKVELERVHKALAADVLGFSPDRAQQGTIEAIRMTTATVIANKDPLVDALMTHFGAPGRREAQGALALVGRVLMALEQLINGAPIGDVKDAMDKVAARNRTRH